MLKAKAERRRRQRGNLIVEAVARETAGRRQFAKSRGMKEARTLMEIRRIKLI